MPAVIHAKPNIRQAIKKSTKEAISFLFRRSGMVYLIRKIFSTRKVTIIVYHSPKPEVFARHIEYLSKHYNFISLNTLVKAIRRKDWSVIPPNGLVITIDDGYKENYKLLDIFREFDVRPTIYLCADVINTNREFWFEVGFDNVEGLKRLQNEERLQVLRRAVGFEQRRVCRSRQALNLTEIEQMSPYVDFQSHSRFHPVLTTCTDEYCREEIGGSKIHLETLLGQRIAHFSYPCASYAKRELEYVKDAGHESARTLEHGWCDINTDPYRLKAMYVDDDASINILCAKATGLFGLKDYLFRTGFHRRYAQDIQ